MSKEIIPYDSIRSHKLSKAEERIIIDCFNQFLTGNSLYCEGELNRLETEEFLHIFKQGWIMHDLFIKGE